MACPFKGGPGYVVSFSAGGKLRSELYLDFPDPEAVSRLYEALLARKDRIEALYGGPLSWEPIPDRRASRIADYTDGDVSATTAHDSYIDWFFGSGSRLRTAIESVATEVMDELDDQAGERGPAPQPSHD